ncbi:hypothetical protein [Clostridium tagluense]|uniref:hypothetical protein n=1 Tax=Clostridium tagluense TaxID=360422 RepID=UPI001CF25700|nr:hypothetical protein [Clostridium tagluense]MCB2298159.1 hypothetical protein [Clostridium tagluense]
MEEESRGRLISHSDRSKIVDLIKEAIMSGSRLYEVCETVGISARTYERWYVDGEVTEDKRPTAERSKPSNKLTKELMEPVLNAQYHLIK